MIVLNDSILFESVWFLLLISLVTSTPFLKEFQILENEDIVIQARGFPSPTTEDENIRISAASNLFIHLMFDDLDLPRGSSFLIYDGYNESVGIPFKTQPKLQFGAWSRPVVTAKSGHLYIKYRPYGNFQNGSYVGFKLTVHADTVEIPSLDAPFTICPSITEPLDGGMVNVTAVTDRYTLIMLGALKFRQDCVWQLKLPRFHVPNILVFIKILSYNLRDSKLEIRNSIHSDATLLLNHSGEKGSLDEKVFQSANGLYVRLQKPLEEGDISFIYGIYKDTSVNPKGGCRFEMDGNSEDGFQCEDSDWCLPASYKCNSLEECPNGDDEPKVTCPTIKLASFLTSPPPTSTTTTSTAMTPSIQQKSTTTEMDCSFNKMCPDGTCVEFFVHCTPVDGQCSIFEEYCKSRDSCMMSYDMDRCPGYCASYKKQCNDGSCVSSWGNCPEDSCTAYKPYDCGDGTCRYESDVCDGIEDCYNGQDEEGCGTAWMSENGMKWLIVIVTIPLFCCCAYWRMKRQGHCSSSTDSSNQAVTLQPATEMTPYTPTNTNAGTMNVATQGEQNRLLGDYGQQGAAHPPTPPTAATYPPPSAPPQPPPFAAPPPGYNEANMYPAPGPVPSAPPPSYSEAVGDQV